MRRETCFFKKTLREVAHIRSKLVKECAPITFAEDTPEQVRALIAVLSQHFPLARPLTVRTDFCAWLDEYGSYPEAVCAVTAVMDNGDIEVVLDLNHQRAIFSTIHEYFHVLQANYLGFRRGRVNIHDETCAYTFEAAVSGQSVQYPPSTYWGQAERAGKMLLRSCLVGVYNDLVDALNMHLEE